MRASRTARRASCSTSRALQALGWRAGITLADGSRRPTAGSSSRASSAVRCAAGIERRTRAGPASFPAHPASGPAPARVGGGHDRLRFGHLAQVVEADLAPDAEARSATTATLRTKARSHHQGDVQEHLADLVGDRQPGDDDGQPFGPGLVHARSDRHGHRARRRGRRSGLPALQAWPPGCRRPATTLCRMWASGSRPRARGQALSVYGPHIVMGQGHDQEADGTRKQAFDQFQSGDSRSTSGVCRLARPGAPRYAGRRQGRGAAAGAALCSCGGGVVSAGASVMAERDGRS